jgi:hypothetical protein
MSSTKYDFLPKELQEELQTIARCKLIFILKIILIIIFKCNGIRVFYRKICKPGCGILAADETPLAMEDRFKGTVKIDTNIFKVRVNSNQVSLYGRVLFR